MPKGSHGERPALRTARPEPTPPPDHHEADEHDRAGHGQPARPPDPVVRVPRQRRRQPGGAPRRPSKTDKAIEAAIAQLVADAPPLSPHTRARLAELFSVTHRARTRK
jgi:hypothetical protein